MKRAIALTVPLLIFIAVLVPIIAAERGLPVNARSALDNYIAYRRRIEGAALQTQLIVHASRPWNFTPKMSAVAIGDSARYQTAYGFSGQPLAIPTPGPPGTVDVLNEYAPHPGDGRMPLPFPPEDVWCVRLDTGQQNFAVVFVALHQDLYNGAWIIHEPTSGLEEALSAIGCDLK